MPQARKSTRSSSRGGASFKEPAALKRLNKSLEAAQKALTELRTSAGRNATTGTRTLHKGIGKFLTDARRDAGKFGTALKRDFDQAKKAASSTKRSTGTASKGRSTSTTTRGRATRRTTAKRTTRKSS